ncbi:MAG: hypothetical protein SOZ90_02990 [Candidatus Faecousia sp.]|nr:hypothetical protein [Candidatus Faecousia sp.]
MWDYNKTNLQKCLLAFLRLSSAWVQTFAKEKQYFLWALAFSLSRWYNRLNPIYGGYSDAEPVRSQLLLLLLLFYPKKVIEICAAILLGSKNGKLSAARISVRRFIFTRSWRK